MTQIISIYRKTRAAAAIAIVSALIATACAPPPGRPGGEIDPQQPQNDTPPSLLVTSPSQGSSGIAGHTPITLGFSAVMDRQSVEDAVSVSPALALSFSWLGDSTLRIDHAAFAPATTYTVTVGPGAKDAQGHPLDTGSVPNPFSFSTAAPQDIRVIESNPEEGALDVSLNQPINLVFSDAVDAESLEAAVSISPDPGGLAFIWQSAQALSIEHADFSPGIPYTLTISQGALGQNGGAVTPFSLTFTTGAATLNEAALLFDEGYLLYLSGDYSGALAVFSEVVADFPSDAAAGQAHYYVGRCYHQLFNYPQARAEYQVVIDTYNYPTLDKVDDAQYQLGMTYYDEQAYAAAIAPLRLTVTNYPDSDSADGAQYYVGKAYHELFNYAQARLEYQRVVDNYVYPAAAKVDDARYQIGKTHYHEANYAESVVHFNAVLSLYGDSDSAPDAQYFIGRARHKMNDFVGARAAYALVLATYSALMTDRLDDAQLEIGVTYYDEANYAVALSELQKVIAGYPLSDSAPEAQFMVGRSYHKSLLFAQARAEYQKAAAHYPTSLFADDALYQFAETYYDEAFYTTALPEFAKVITSYPSGDAADNAQYRIGRCYDKLADYPRARIEYQRVLANYPASEKSDDTQFRIAITYHQEVLLSQEVAELNTLIQNYPTSVRVTEAQAHLDDINGPRLFH